MSANNMARYRYHSSPKTCHFGQSCHCVIIRVVMTKHFPFHAASDNLSSNIMYFSDDLQQG